MRGLQVGVNLTRQVDTSPLCLLLEHVNDLSNSDSWIEIAHLFRELMARDLPYIQQVLNIVHE